MAKELFKKKIKLGYKERPIEADKKETYYPSMWINDTDLPLEAEDVGKTFTAQIKLEVVGVDSRADSKGKKFDYHFDVKEIAFQEDK